MSKCCNLWLVLVFFVGFPPGVLAYEQYPEQSNKLALQQRVREGTVIGVISDSMCKFDHVSMIKGGHAKDAATCTLNCVKSGHKLVLCDKKQKAVYRLTNPELAKRYAGKLVALSGHIDSKAKVIHIHRIKAQ